jgi:hypothetical protein
LIIISRSPPWTADLRAERDLLRQLVPGPWSASSSPAADSRGESCKPEGWHSPEAMIASATTVHDPHPDRLPLPENYTIEDANADFFD